MSKLKLSLNKDNKDNKGDKINVEAEQSKKKVLYNITQVPSNQKDQSDKTHSIIDDSSNDVGKKPHTYVHSMIIEDEEKVSHQKEKEIIEEVDNTVSINISKGEKFKGFGKPSDQTRISAETSNRLRTSNTLRFKPKIHKEVKPVPVEKAKTAKDNVSKDKSKETDSSAKKDVVSTENKFKSLPPKQPIQHAKKRRSSSKGMKQVSNFSSINMNSIMTADDFENIDSNKGETRSRSWGRNRKKKAKVISHIDTVYPTEISVHLPITIIELAKKLKRKASELISFAVMGGMDIRLDSSIDSKDIIELIADNFKCSVTFEKSISQEESIFESSISNDIESIDNSMLLDRPPVVVLMGHVDHGKTSIIDFFRKSNIVDKEFGSITQNIGAFEVETKFSKITVIDTPGHAAFSMVRSQGATFADIVLLVISGEDGVKEQTIESIKAAKSSGASMVIALTKCDKPEFNADKIYSSLSSYDIVPEAWGGDVIAIPCSPLTGEGMTELAEAISLQAEISGLKYSPTVSPRGFVVASYKDDKKGNSTTIILKNGELRKGDVLGSKVSCGIVRQIKSFDGKPLDVARPSTPVEIFGLNNISYAGDEVGKFEKLVDAKKVIEDFRAKHKEDMLISRPNSSVELMKELNEVNTNPINVINIVVKAPTKDMLHATVSIIKDMEFKRTKIHVVSSGVGSINNNDVETAEAFDATIVGFQTGFLSGVKDSMNKKNKEINHILCDIIYRIPEALEKLAKTQAAKQIVYEQKATLEILVVFKSSKAGKIAGCIVRDGLISKSSLVTIERKGTVIVDKVPITSMRTSTQDIKEARKDSECGLILQKFSDFKVGDIIKAFSSEQVDLEI